MSTDEPTATYATVPLGGGRGTTWISDDIVSKAAAAAALEVEGVHELARPVRAGGWLRGSDRRRGEVEVAVEGQEASITLSLVAEDDISIPAMVDAVRARIVERVEFVTGLRVRQVDIGVVDVATPAAREPAPARQPKPSPY